MSTKLRLITIPVSHYCEKARWALEYLQIPFQEFAHMPPFHQIAAKKYSGTSLPILVADTQIIRDSTEILRYLDTLQPGKLYPAEPELHVFGTELETLFNDNLGVNTRRWGYSAILTPELIYPKWTQGVPTWQKLLFPIVFPQVKSIVRKRFQITETSTRESYREIEGVFDLVSQILGDGRKYLLGDQFSAIDLTFAALAAPILQPPEHHIPPSPIELAPTQIQDDVRACQATRAGEFGLRLYREHRH
ncbi:MAG: glutathione S-transferase [Chroococcidiopsidaceae cyanobacterium CP_BM_RX_35]|nr:glutathione S-transferase [Chroococcidiopsidaceae cyanobacterium CP_BM_RX_35]